MTRRATVVGAVRAAAESAGPPAHKVATVVDVANGVLTVDVDRLVQAVPRLAGYAAPAVGDVVLLAVAHGGQLVALDRITGAPPDAD